MVLPRELLDRIAPLVGEAPVRAEGLAGGCVAEVLRLSFSGRADLVLKAGGGGRLDLEGWMLQQLRERSSLPVPEVLVAEPDLLLMESLPGGTGLSGRAQGSAARHFAALHNVTGARFGLGRDTLIGPLPQPNREDSSWPRFFATQRLLPMAHAAHQVGGLSSVGLKGVEALATRLAELLPEAPPASLLHGDLWCGNVLSRGGRLTGVIDPAIYHGHAEVDLAFGTMFGTLGERFFAVYQEIRPIEPGFFGGRQKVYNIYPLLVHARLFGGGYGQQVERDVRGFL